MTRVVVACAFPDQLSATVLHGDQAEVALRHVPDMLSFVIELPPIDGDTNSYFTRFTVPFAHYPGPGGVCMGMIEIPGRNYKFHFSDRWGARMAAGTQVTLIKPKEQEYRIFEKYQLINGDVSKSEDSFVPTSLQRLKSSSAAVQQRFDRVLRRTAVVVEAAIQAWEKRGPAVDTLLTSFMPSAWTPRKRSFFRVRLGANLYAIRSVMPMLKRNKLDVIGFGMPARVGRSRAKTRHGDYQRAEGLAGSMALDMEFNHINKALINFNRHHFDSMPIDALVSDLLHELSHARFGSLDTIGAKFQVSVYPGVSPQDPSQIDIAPLVAAAGQLDSDSANHASTFEHLVMTLAYTQSADTFPLLGRFFNGGTSYSQRADNKLSPCVLGRSSESGASAGCRIVR